MVDRDFYNVLGVERSATPEQVKRAYRRLAMRWHPDRNRGDKIAEQRFREVSAAYRVLADPLDRARYNRLGPLFFLKEDPHKAEELAEAVRRAWRDLVGRKARGEPIHYALQVSLEEAATGTEREISLPRKVVCEDCQGLGATSEHREICTACDGTGRARNMLRSPCFHCQGRGYHILTPCSTCGGEGLVEQTDTLRVHVPPGVDTGSTLRVADRGHESTDPGAPGDLLLVIHVQEHPIFTRQGPDLHLSVPLRLDEVLAGTDLEIPTLEGQTVVRIPPGMTHDAVLRLKDRGMPLAAGKTSERGDLLLNLRHELPTGLTPEQVRGLQAWIQTLPETAHPERARWAAQLEHRS